MRSKGRESRSRLRPSMGAMQNNLGRSGPCRGTEDRARPTEIVTGGLELGRQPEHAEVGSRLERPRQHGARVHEPSPRRLIAFALVLTAVFMAGLAIAPHTAHGLRDSLEGAGAWAPVVVAAVYVLLTCAMVPGPVLAGASGLVLGTARGTAVAIVSATLGATLAFLIARRFAHSSFAAIAGRRLSRWTARIQARGFLAVLYARIAPGAP